MVVVFHHSYTVRARILQACGRVGRAVVMFEHADVLREFLKLNRAGAILVEGADAETPDILRDLRSNPATATVPILWLGDAPVDRNQGPDKILIEPDLYLPLDEVDTRLEIELQRIFLPTAPEPAPATEDGMPLRVLVIDDSLTYRMQLRDALISGGYHVALAETGEAGLEEAMRGGYGAVLVDNILPGIQGATVIRRLRSSAATRRIPCLLLTASEDPENELDALEAGADSFLRKDEPKETILLRLAAVLRTSSAPSAFRFLAASARRVLMAGPRVMETAALRESLLSDGVILVEEPDPEPVIARALRDSFDAILVSLPHAQALTLCRRLKQTPQLSATRVLLMECLVDPAEPLSTSDRQVTALQAGADDFLSCSLPVRNLRARLETQLRRKQMEDENRTLHDHILRQQIEADSQRRLAEARTEHAEEMRQAKDAVVLEAQQAEDARNRLEQLMDALPQMVLLSSIDGVLFSANRRFEEYIGERPGASTTDMWRVLMPAEDAERYLSSRALAGQQGEGFYGEYRIRAASGELRWFYLQVIPMRESGDVNGSEIRWLCTCTDIHDRKLAEEALRRTEKLAATGRLAASIAHEINNPLEAVTNLLYLAETGSRDKDGPVHEYVQTAQQEVARVSEIAKKTLAFYRETKNPARVDLGRLVQETQDVYETRLKQKGLTLQVDNRTARQPIGLSGELRQVISNLIANAIDASPRGTTIWIRIRSSRHVLTGREGVRVVVWDRGEGIPESLRPDLFKPFTTSKGQGGTGLGLWVATSIAMRHEGDLRFWSSTNKPRNGTCFTFFLPVDGNVKLSDDTIGTMLKQIGSELLNQ